jgi:hypothetical protein
MWPLRLISGESVGRLSQLDMGLGVPCRILEAVLRVSGKFLRGGRISPCLNRHWSRLRISSLMGWPRLLVMGSKLPSGVGLGMGLSHLGDFGC